MKPRIRLIDDPDMIASIVRNGLRDIIGWSRDGCFWAYAFSVQRWLRAKNLPVAKPETCKGTASKTGYMGDVNGPGCDPDTL